MPGGELPGIAGVEHDGTGVQQRRHVRQLQRRRAAGGVEDVVATSVEHGVVHEVVRRGRLPDRHQGEEILLAHRDTGVVPGALLADGRPALGREVLAARRAGTVRGEDPYPVGQGHQPAHRRMQHAAELVGGVADRRQQIGPTDIPDEQRVAGEHRVGHLVPGMLADQQADRLRGVPRRLPDLQ